MPRSARISRYAGSALDIGAVALNQLVVTTTADEDDAGLGLGEGNSLREVIGAAGEIPRADLILFSPSLNHGTIILGASQLTVYSDVMIDASTLPAGITVSGNSASRVFEFLCDVSVSIFGLTVSGGNVANPDGGNYGGGISNRGYLVIKLSVIYGNFTTGTGGGIEAGNGHLYITNSSLLNNHADSGGGGIASCSTDLRLDNTTIANNSSGENAGGIRCSAYYGSPQISLVNCTLFNNIAADNGGAYWGGGLQEERKHELRQHDVFKQHRS